MAILKQIKTFQNKLKGMSGSQIKMASADAIDWFRNNVRQAISGAKDNVQNRWLYKRIPGADKEFKSGIRMTRAPMIGHMYFYVYDPKWKNELPYYDMFPLVIPIDYSPGGFYGMNFHYLPYMLRAQLLDTLLSLKAATYNAGTGRMEDYIRVSYDLLKGMGKTVYKPTIKQYLYSHVKSPYAQVAFEEWEQAVFMPVESFKKANKREVWSDSRSRI